MPRSDFLAWLTTATLRFISLAEHCHTQIFKDELKNEDDLKNDDDLENKDDLKNGGDQKK